MTDAARSMLIHMALATTPALASGYERGPRIELMVAGLVFVRGGRLQLTLDGCKAALPLLRELLDSPDDSVWSSANRALGRAEAEVGQ